MKRINLSATETAMTTVRWKDQTKLVARPIKLVMLVKFWWSLPLVIVICRSVEPALIEALPLADKTRRNEGKLSRKCRDKNYCRGQNVMSLINFLMSSHCTVDKDIFLCDMMKLRAFVSKLGNEISLKYNGKPYQACLILGFFW